jgi:hypothetical protein
MKRVDWLVIENIVVIVAIVVGFIFTRSAWCFLLMLCINGFNSDKK